MEGTDAALIGRLATLEYAAEAGGGARPIGPVDLRGLASTIGWLPIPEPKGRTE
jgi:hypothetical protein